MGNYEEAKRFNGTYCVSFHHEHSEVDSTRPLSRFIIREGTKQHASAEPRRANRPEDDTRCVRVSLPFLPDFAHRFMLRRVQKDTSASHSPAAQQQSGRSSSQLSSGEQTAINLSLSLDTSAYTAFSFRLFLHAPHTVLPSTSTSRSSTSALTCSYSSLFVHARYLVFGIRRTTMLAVGYPSSHSRHSATMIIFKFLIQPPLSSHFPS